MSAPSDDCGLAHLTGCINSAAYTLAPLYPANPTGYGYGDEARNVLHGPGSQTVNFSLSKIFPIKERLHFQFRCDAFNLFNHANFGNPSATFGTSSFGNITSAAAARSLQLGAKLSF